MEYSFYFLNQFNEDPADVLLFRDPEDIISCDDPADIASCFDRIDKALSDGMFVAGYLAYELGYYFMGIPLTYSPSIPLICFGIFKSPQTIKKNEFLESLPLEDPQIENLRYSLSPEKYKEDFARIKDHLEAGNTYQVNYTFKNDFGAKGSYEALFRSLLARQDAPYSSLLRCGEWYILSFSPEIFFERNNSSIFVRPMKGTISRGRDAEEDDLNIDLLKRSSKDRAENIMIVDLLRNDLGIISEAGSVKTNKLFDIEKYETLFQMTSTVSARIKTGLSWHTFFKSVFPSGSVTGAPKKRTMEIIKDIEGGPRNIYTGSIGYICPSGRSVFNVAIRTMLINKKTHAGEMGIGSGLVYDSSDEKEFEECVLKGEFMSSIVNDKKFYLIETILWENSSFFLMALHLKRLKKSAEYFNIVCREEHVMSKLDELSGTLSASDAFKVRLTLDQDGTVEITASPLPSEARKPPVTICLSDEPINKNDVFFYHKTSERSVYVDARRTCHEKGCFDMIFFNDKNEITEGSITNIMIKKDGAYLTPPVYCGLLNGVYRQYLLESQDVPLKEKVLYIEDLKNADEIFVLNSVRRSLKAELVP